MRGIFYTLSPALKPETTSEHLTQLRASILSLRRVNADIPVYLFTFGLPCYVIERALEGIDVQIIAKPIYSSALGPYCGERAAIFAQYPTLSRWLVLEDFRPTSISSLLYVDTDTYFVCDPTRLFDEYNNRDWYTREEPSSSNSPLGYDSEYINEEALGALANELSTCSFPPMNLGVVLLNNRVWERVQLIMHDFFTYMWRFLLGMARNGHPRIMEDWKMQPILKEVTKLAKSSDWIEALQYPSSNGWILDELSMLLAIGRIERLTCGFLSPNRVLQGDEFASTNTFATKKSGAILCHYFSKNHDRFMQWLKSLHKADREGVAHAVK
jgi:hypothetical protein